MQAEQTSQSVTWVTFAIESVKILGPALFTLGGSWIAWKYQKSVKKLELEEHTRLKARELMFHAYHDEVKSQLNELKEYGKALMRLESKLRDENPEQKKEALSQWGEAITALLVPIFASTGRLERELEELGLTERFKTHLAFVKKYQSSPIKITDGASASKAIEENFLFISMLSIINQELLTMRREKLFGDYLPSRIERK